MRSLCVVLVASFIGLAMVMVTGFLLINRRAEVLEKCAPGRHFEGCRSLFGEPVSVSNPVSGTSVNLYKSGNSPLGNSDAVVVVRNGMIFEVINTDLPTGRTYVTSKYGWPR